MRKSLVFTAAVGLALCLAAGSARAVTAGPDYFGYTLIDSAEAGLDYSWVDMSGGTAWTAMTDDLQSGSIPLGFTFNFYGVDYTAVHLYTNGMIRFSTMTYEFFYGNQCPLPSPGETDGMIGWYHRDHNPADASWCAGGNCDVWYSTGNDGTRDWFGMTFVNVPQCCSSDSTLTVDYISAQVLMYDTGEILVNIQDAGTAAGGDATIGIEDPDALSGLNYPGCVTDDSLTDNLSILFTPPAGGTPVLPPSGIGWDQPSNTVTHDFTVFNLESSDVTFALASGGGESWTTTPSVTSLPVTAGTSATFSVDVDIPSAAAGGDTDEATVTLTPGAGTPIDVDLLTLAQPAGDSWQDLSDMPQVVELPAVASIGAELFIMGGMWHDTLSAQDYVMNDVQVLNTDLMIWDHYEPASTEAMPSALTMHAACAMNGLVYVTGGQTGDATTPQNVNVYILDPATMTWTTGPTPMAEARMGHAMVCDDANDMFYIIGGYGPFDVGGTAYPVADILAYDLSDDTWDTGLTASPGTRVLHAAEMIDADTILVTSGAFDSFMSNRSDLYTISSDTWSQTGDTVFMRWSSASGVLPTGIMCLSGGNSDMADAGEDTFECYYDGFWIPMIPTLTEAKLNTAGTTMNDQLYVVGGLTVDTVGGTTEQVATVERYPTSPIPDITIDVVEDTTEDTMGDVPADVPEDTDPGDVVVDMPTDSSTDAPTDVTTDTGDEPTEDSGCGCAIVY